MMKLGPKMIDKLTLRPLETITNERACQLLQGKYQGNIITRSNHFNNVSVFYTGAPKRSPTLLSLHTEPRNCITGSVKIELNPSHFKSFKDLMSVLEVLVMPSTTKVSRLDCSVDVEIPIEKVNRLLIVARKRARLEYNEGKGLTGVVYGKQPELFCIYDKAYQSKTDGPLTRIELRQFKNKVPIETLEDLPLLLSHKPFSKLKFVDTKNTNEISVKDHVKASLFREAAQRLGATGAIKSFNLHHNFTRGFSRILDEKTEMPDLDLMFQENLNTFFKGESSGY